MRILPSYTKEPPTCRLYSCGGSVHPIAEFVRRFSQILAPHEQDLLRTSSDILAAVKEIPSALSKPLTRSPWLGAAPSDSQAVESGERSAYIRNMGIKIKGCAPSQESRTFPYSSLRFGHRIMRRQTVPFGVLTAEGVMREMLGYCFLKKNDLPTAAAPVCVYEYSYHGEQMGYSLVLHAPTDRRASSFVDWRHLLFRDLIRHAGENTEDNYSVPFGSEARLIGLNALQYHGQKSRILSSLHFKGGFRGILNSNLSNDILLSPPGGAVSLAVCDFDSFYLVEVPQKPDERFLGDFATAALAEVVMGSVPILGYLEFESGAPPENIIETLAGYYQGKSCSWQHYIRAAEFKCDELGWDVATLRRAFAQAFSTPLFLELVRACLLCDANFPRSAKIPAEVGILDPGKQ